jgi:hypothetical protein
MLHSRAQLIVLHLNSYDSVSLARAMLRGSFSDSPQASTAPIVRESAAEVHFVSGSQKLTERSTLLHHFTASKLSRVLSPSSPSSAPAPSSDQRRLSVDSARSVSPEWENTIPSPGIPLLVWIAQQDAKDEAARRRAEQRGSVEEEDADMGAGDDRYDINRRSPGTPTVDDALMYFARPEAPPVRPPLGITLSASSAAVYGSTTGNTPSSPSSHSTEAGPSYSATGRLYHPPSSKPFKCPTEGCDKAYKQANGLKYHLKHGKCSNDPEVIAKEEDASSNDMKRFACHQTVDCGKRYKK